MEVNSMIAYIRNNIEALEEDNEILKDNAIKMEILRLKKKLKKLEGEDKNV